MPGRLVISTEEGVALELRLEGLPVTIGRGGDNSLRTSDRRTSRKHAVIRPTPIGEDYEVEDQGSSFGTTLNGRSITRERLRHLDLLVCGGIQAQFYADPPEKGGKGPAMEPGAMEVHELRGQLRQLIQEHADLRRMLGEKMDTLSSAEQQRDEHHDELQRLRQLLQEQRSHQAHLEAMIERLGQDLLNERGAKTAPPPETETLSRLQRQLEEAQKQAQRLRARAVELEEHEAQSAQRERALREKLAKAEELLAKHEQRAAELAKVVQPALRRIAELTDELERVRRRAAEAEPKDG